MKATGTGRAVLVTTAHKGVFFGYAKKTDGPTIALTGARLAIYWSSDMEGFMGLAAKGPSNNCKIGPRADIELRDITSVTECTRGDEALGEGVIAMTAKLLRGDGSGYGYGDGDGSGYWLAVFESHFKTCPRLLELRADPDVQLAFWWSDKNGRPSNGGSSSEQAQPGLIQKTKGPLKLCTKRALHATIDPSKWKGERLWIVALSGETTQQGDKLGGTVREIICEVDLAA